jgi:arylsulfatase A-like enzyme/Tfp pilus assembly protein PilF
VTRRQVVALALAIAALALAVGLQLAGRRGEPPSRASVLLVTLDTLRADRVAAWGGAAGLTPNLDALAARGLVFEEALASAPLTLPSHATILTGLEPPRHGVHDNGTYVVPAELETLATRLKAAGYETGAFVGAYVLDRRFGLARGFDHYDDRIARNESGASVLESERRGGEVASAAADWLRARNGPFFAWVHLYDAHAPYEAPSPYREAQAGRPYDAEVAYVDACVGRVLEAARQASARGARGEPLVAVVADHGESLGEHGELTHGFFVYQATLRVPFLLAGPRVPAGERRKGTARTVDLLPTLLGRLGLAAPAGLDGADLLAAAAPPREAYAETFYPATFGWSPLRSFRMGSLKLVDAPRPELFDLASDPQEADDLAPQRAESVERLRQALRALVGRGRPASSAAADPATEERLRALGYVTAAAAPDLEPTAGRPAPRDRVTSYRAFEEAVWADARGDRDAAVAGLRRLVDEDPQNLVFRRTLASALRRGGRTLEAVEVAGIPGRTRDDAVAWHERAQALAAAGRRAQAEASAKTALQLNPLLPELHNHMGALLAPRGRTAEALAHFEAAAELDPNNAKAWNNRANALRALRRPDEARQAYERAAALAPRDPDPLNGLGALAVESSRFDEAASLFRRALELAPGMGEARLNLAVALAQAGRQAEALAELDRLLRASPSRELAAQAARLRRELQGLNPSH